MPMTSKKLVKGRNEMWANRVSHGTSAKHHGKITKASRPAAPKACAHRRLRGVREDTLSSTPAVPGSATVEMSIQVEKFKCDGAFNAESRRLIPLDFGATAANTVSP